MEVSRAIGLCAPALDCRFVAELTANDVHGRCLVCGRAYPDTTQVISFDSSDHVGDFSFSREQGFGDLCLIWSLEQGYASEFCPICTILPTWDASRTT